MNIIYGLSNIVKSPTCYKSLVPTMIDVIISNQPKRLQGVTTIDTGLSDFHHMICCSTKLLIPKRVPKTETNCNYQNIRRYDMEKAALNIKVRSNGTKFQLILNKLHLFMILNVIYEVGILYVIVPAVFYVNLSQYNWDITLVQLKSVCLISMYIILYFISPDVISL